MKISISDPAELRRITGLARQVDVHDAAIDAAGADAAELRNRRASLARRLAEHRQARPAAAIAIDDALVDAIAADPASRPEGGAYATAIDRQRAAREAVDEWQVQLTMLEAAVAKLDRELAAAAAKTDRLEGERYAAWVEFVRGAHEALAAEFAARFAELHDSIMAPMQALCELKNKSGLGAIVAQETPQFTRKTIVELQRYKPAHIGASIFGGAKEIGPDLITDRLFPAASLGLAPIDYAGQVDAFHAALVSRPGRRA